MKVGHFEVLPVHARKMLEAPLNPNNKPNSDVIVPWINAKDLTDRPKGMYIVDFLSMTEAEAALYELPFEYVKHHVYQSRQRNSRPRRKQLWWQHGEKNLGMRKALRGLGQYIATPRVSKHRFFQFVPVSTLADSRVVVIARGDPYFLGVLESAIHRTWSLAISSRHGDGGDGGRITYNIETCFDPFPFPWAPREEPVGDARVKNIADATAVLVELRNATNSRGRCGRAAVRRLWHLVLNHRQRAVVLEGAVVQVAVRSRGLLHCGRLWPRPSCHSRNGLRLRSTPTPEDSPVEYPIAGNSSSN